MFTFYAAMYTPGANMTVILGFFWVVTNIRSLFWREDAVHNPRNNHSQYRPDRLANHRNRNYRH